MQKLAIAALLLAVSPPPAAAWNNAGHMTAAGVAYLSLSPEVRTRVDELLRQHPDFARIAGDFPPDDPDFGAVVFMRAAIWPDLIRGDSRFFDDTNPEAEPTPALPGFPDMGIHKPWHFIDLPFTFDAAAVSQPDEVNAQTQIVAFRSALGDPDVTASEQAYDLSWLLHLVGDIHQPLHSAARFSALHPSGDRGGNSFLINSNERNLHSFWDRSLGTDDDPERALALAGQLRERFQVDPGELEIASAAPAESTVLRWVEESATLARYVVYTIGDERGQPPHPRPARTYRRLANTLANHRVAIAGQRIAAILDDRLD